MVMSDGSHKRIDRILVNAAVIESKKIGEKSMGNIITLSFFNMFTVSHTKRCGITEPGSLSKVEINYVLALVVCLY